MTDTLDQMLRDAGQNRHLSKDLERLSKYAVKHDRYDMQEFNEILLAEPGLSNARQKLAETIAGDLGIDVSGDMFWLLWKTMPRLLTDDGIRPSRLVNKRVESEAVQLASYERLRGWTASDPIASALGFEKMEPELAVLYDRLQQQMDKQQEYEDALREALERRADAQTAEGMYDEWLEARTVEEEEGDEGDGGQSDEDDGQGEAMQQAVQGAQAAADAAEGVADIAMGELQASLNGAGKGIRESLQKAFGDASEYLEMLDNMSQAWGSDPGQLMRLPAKKRLELAKRMDTDEFRLMAKLIGPFMSFAFAENLKKVTEIPEEIVDITLGDDLRHVVADEFGSLMLEETEILFYARLAEQGLLQYDLIGHDKIARGGIIYCHDGSSSMQGQREIWAKAIGLALLNLAVKQKRSFYGIQFGTASEIRIDDFHDWKNVQPEKVIDFAEFFFNGGTNFERPLAEAMKILEKEHAEFGAVRHDIVFATDGHAAVSPKFMEDLKVLQKRLDVTIWGVNVAAGKKNETRLEPLNEICDGRVATVHSLLHAKDMKSVFRGL